MFDTQSTFRERLSYAAVLCALIAAAGWGHHTRWRFVTGGRLDSADLDASHGAPASARPTSAPSEVRLASAAALGKSGIELATVERRPMDEFIVANGTVTYDQNHVAQLASRVPGIVWRIEKTVGQPIKKGDVLAIIDAAEVGRAKADFLQAIVHAESKNKTLERLRDAGSSIPERQLREARSEQREAKIKLYNAQQTLVNLGLPVYLNDIQQFSDEALVRHVQFLGLPPSIRTTLDPETTTANLLPIVAPLDGVVIGRDISIGEVVASSRAQFTVADVSRMWVKLQVRKEDANLVRIGQKVAFKDDSVAGEIQGRIDWISTEVDEQTRTLEVRADVENPILSAASPTTAAHRQLKARTFGTGRILVRENPAATTVPNQAIQREDDQYVVFVRTADDTFQMREVEVGVLHAPWIEVRTGLSVGEVVAARGSHMLKAEAVRSRLTAALP